MPFLILSDLRDDPRRRLLSNSKPSASCSELSTCNDEILHFWSEITSVTHFVAESFYKTSYDFVCEDLGNSLISGVELCSFRLEVMRVNKSQSPLAFWQSYLGTKTTNKDLKLLLPIQVKVMSEITSKSEPHSGKKQTLFFL